MFSHYYRTTNLFRTKYSFSFDNDCSLHYMDENEVQSILKLVRKHNLGVRVGWINNFYAKRIQDLTNRTVIRIFYHGIPNRITETISKKAEMMEKLLLLSTVLNTSKNSLIKK